jgi:hypothetical protein
VARVELLEENIRNSSKLTDDLASSLIAMER